jgi:hypothetical protein
VNILASSFLPDHLNWNETSVSRILNLAMLPPASPRILSLTTFNLIFDRCVSTERAEPSPNRDFLAYDLEKSCNPR